jgi:hypothetical protein
MGQAAVDLPDPLNSSPPADSNAGADDLLAQLAGDEIDRLLAESDEDAAKPIGSSGRALEPVPANPASPADDAEQLDDVLKQLDGSAAVSEGEVAKAVASAPKQAVRSEEMYAKALDQSIAERVTPVVDKVRQQVASEEEEAAAMKAVQAASLTAPSRSAGEELQTTAEERAALGATIESTEQAEAEPSAMSSSQLLDYADNITLPLPIYLRPLEWLSAPLNAFPDTVRELIGKAAIITMFNAVAILAYVMLFRKG